MLNFFILCTLAVLAQGANLKSRSRREVSNDVLLKVIGPIVTPDLAHLFTYQVSYQEDCGQTCGGTIVSERIIITAAHCVERIEPRRITINVESINKNQKGQVADVFEYKVHQNFNRLTLYNDIAVMILQQRLDLTSIRPAILPDAGVSFIGELAVVSGWGHQPNDLTYTTMKIIEKKECRHPSQLCADPVIPTTELYKGDSGGPLVVRMGDDAVLVGISSGFIGPSVTQHVFTNVAHLRSWIDEVIGESETLIPVIEMTLPILINNTCFEKRIQL